MEGTPREWIFVQLRNEWYVRENTWKLNHLGELFDMHEAPFAETLVPAETTDAAAIAARKRLQAVLARLDPAAGKTERGRKKDASFQSTSRMNSH
jgi:hypothetical protein